MDWTLGALIVSGLLNLVLSILRFQELANKAKLFVGWLRRWLLGRPVVIREWCRWGKHQPSWKVLEGGGIKIIPKPRGEYHISVTIPIRYTSRDNNYWTRITHTAYNQKLEIKHSGSNREGNPYLLSGDARPSQVDLPPMQYKDTMYQFKKTVRAEPLLGKTAQCRLRRGANVYLVGIHTDRFLGSRKRFPLEVSCEQGARD